MCVALRSKETPKNALAWEQAARCCDQLAALREESCGPGGPASESVCQARIAVRSTDRIHGGIGEAAKIR